jgi:CMP-N,N'-diacetyllegionaminic acid synthase
VEVLGVVPARGGSKGISRKNLRLLAGHALIHHTFEAARSSELLTRVIVSTEDDEIAAVARSEGVEVLHRPEQLARDDTPMAPVLQHALRWLQDQEAYWPEIVALLQPTAPLRRGEHIDGALRLLLQRGANSVVSVCQVPGHYHPEWQFMCHDDGELVLWSGEPIEAIPSRRQSLPPTFTRNGAVYAMRTAVFLERETLYARPCVAFVMPPSASVNVDGLADFAMAEWWLAQARADSSGKGASSEV